MEAGSLDGDSAAYVGGFLRFGSVLGENVRRDITTGLDGSRGPKETLQSWNLHSDD